MCFFHRPEKINNSVAQMFTLMEINKVSGALMSAVMGNNRKYDKRVYVP